MLQFGVAKELGMGLSELRATMTAEEIIGWSAYFQVINEDQEKEFAKARRRRLSVEIGFIEFLWLLTRGLLTFG